jgi:hypothetical protein
MSKKRSYRPLSTPSSSDRDLKLSEGYKALCNDPFSDQVRKNEMERTPKAMGVFSR